jgi:hypothetical protein
MKSELDFLQFQTSGTPYPPPQICNVYNFSYYKQTTPVQPKPNIWKVLLFAVPAFVVTHYENIISIGKRIYHYLMK